MTKGTKPPAGHSTAILVLGVLLLFAQGCAGRIHPASPAVVRPTTFMATAYCTGWATSVGTPVAEGIVAADPKLLPIGTVIRVTGLSKPYRGDYTVMDTGPRIRGRRLDVYIADCAQAVRFGRRSVGVTVLRERNHR